MASAKLSDEEIRNALSSIPEWIVANGKLHREYKFRDFNEAWSFMNKAALISEKLDHHPEWTNVYNRITIDLWTHDSGGITERDISWIRALEKASTR